MSALLPVVAPYDPHAALAAVVMQLCGEGITPDLSAGALDRAVEATQRMLSALGIESADPLPAPSNVVALATFRAARKRRHRA